MHRQKVKGISVLFDRDKQLWRIWFHINRQRWTEPGGYATKPLAEGVAAEYGRRHRLGEDIRPPKLREPAPVPSDAPTPGTLRAEAAAWLVDNQKQRKGQTNRFYERVLRVHIFPVLGEALVTERGLTRKMCIAFAKGLVGKVSTQTERVLAHDSRLGIIATLSSFCQWARDQHPDTFPHNPADRLQPHIVDADELKAPILVWTHEQVDRLLKTAQRLTPWWYPLLWFAIKTGLRAGEIVELQWDLDFTIPGYVQVNRQYQHAPRQRYDVAVGGGLASSRDEAAPRIVSTKGRNLRLIPLRPDADQLLKQLRATHRAWAFKKGKTLLPFCFLGVHGGRVKIGYFERHVLPKLCREAKVPVTTKFHTTRHTFASVLLYAGVDKDKVSEWLGHATTAFTERHYKHFIRDTRRDGEVNQQVDAAWRVARGRK